MVAVLTFGFGLTGVDRWIISPLFPVMAAGFVLGTVFG